MATKSDATSSYMPQLDALRFFAVMGVLLAHLWHPRRLPWILGDLDWAGLGVRLFFVLSGFLITGILLGCREAADHGSRSPMFYIRQFYTRRFLRIFPIYYLVVFLGLVLNIEPAREIWGWLVTYTTNIYITINNEWVGRFGHFWTLAVEEQFYFIWPWLVLFAPRKWLAPIIVFLIALSPAYRAYAYATTTFDIGAMDFKAATFLFANLDSLGTGALIALVWHSNFPKEKVQSILTRVVLPIGLILFLVCLVLYHYRIKPSVFFVFGDLSASLIFAWLVFAAARGFSGLPGKVLSFAPLTYLGKITYGIYVYHYFMPLILSPALAVVGIQLQIPGRMNFLLSTLLTIVVSMLSWHLIELPINNLKRYFPYDTKVSLTKTETNLAVSNK